jgi:hypothetical protein
MGYAMRDRRPWIAAAVVVVFAMIIVIGLQQRQGDVAVVSPSPTVSARASATASVAAATASTAASASPAATGGSAVYNDAFGFIVSDVGAGAFFRKESSSAPLASFDHAGFAVAPDGKLTAFWKPGPQMELQITGGASELTLVTLAAGTRGGGIAWSSDGAGLLYSTETGSFGIGGGTNSATLNIYEIAANGRHGTTIDTQTNTGWLYRPIAWDRAANLAAAGLTGEGAAMAFYVTVRMNADGSNTVQRADTRSSQAVGMSMGSVRGSTDAKLVLGIDGSTVVWWPITDIAAKKTAAGTGQSGALWQPGTHKIGFLDVSGGFVLLQTDDGSASTPFKGAKAGSTVRTFRADGSAVVLAFFPQGSTGLGSTDYTLVRLADGASVTFQATGGLRASVRFQ